MKLNRLIAASVVGFSLLTTSTSAFACEHDSHSWSFFGICSHSFNHHDGDHDRDHDRDHNGDHNCNHGGSTGGGSTSGGGHSTGGGGTTTPPVGPKG
jgi:uncharacterized membrane protein YgcG